jgi:predicted ester cyclase
MTYEANKAIAREFFEAVNRHEGPAMVDRLLSPAFMLNGYPWPPSELIDLFTWAETDVPDWHFTVEDMIAEGDQVAVRLSVSGTPRERWRRYKTNGQSFTSKGFFFLRIVDGVIVEGWDQFNELWELQQLGALPTPEEFEGQS